MDSLASTAGPAPRRSLATVRHIQRHVLPFLTEGVPLAVASAGPALRLCAETYRASDNLTRDLRTDKLKPRLHDSGDHSAEESGWLVYDSKLARRCGVRVGPLIMTLHDNSEDQRRQAESLLLAELLPADGRASWKPSTGHLPPVPFFSVEDFVAAHKVCVGDSFPHTTSSAIALGSGAAAQTVLATLRERMGYDHAAAGTELDEAYRLPQRTVLGGRSEYFGQLDYDPDDFSMAKSRAGWQLVWQQMLRERRAKLAAAGRDSASDSTNDSAAAHAQSPDHHTLKRSVYLWTEGVQLPQQTVALLATEEDGGEELSKQQARTEHIAAARCAAVRELISLSRWWLLRTGTGNRRRRTGEDGGGGEAGKDAWSMPTHLFLCSSTIAAARAACRAFCEPDSPASPRETTLHLEGFHLSSHPTDHLTFDEEPADDPLGGGSGAESNSLSFFRQAVLARLKVLDMSQCRLTVQTLLTALRPYDAVLPGADGSDGQAAAQPPSPGHGASPLMTWLPCLEAVNLSGHRDLEGLPVIWPVCPPEDERRFKLDVRLVRPPLLPNLTTLNLSYTGLTNEWLALIALTCSRVFAMDVSHCRDIADLNVLAKVAETDSATGLAETLTFLNASTIPVTDAGIERLSELRCLTSVNLSNCVRLTDVTPLTKLPLLRALDLVNTRVLTGIESLCANERLEHLVLVGEVRPWRDQGDPRMEGSSGESGLFSLPARPSSLTSAAAAPRSLAPPLAFRALTCLAIHSVAQFTSEDFTLLCQSGAPLQWLLLGNLHRLTSLNGIAQTERAPILMQETLQLLYMYGNSLLTTEGIRGLSTCQALRDISVRYCARLRNLGSVLTKIASLQTLQLEMNSDIHDHEGGADRVGHALDGYEAAALTTAVASSGDGGTCSLQQQLSSRQLSILSIANHDDLVNVPFLSGMPWLRVLHAASTGITNASLAAGVASHLAAVATGLSGLPAQPTSSLHSIDLSYCSAVTDVSCLSRLPTLRAVCLARTGVTDAGLQELIFHPSSSVEVLDLTGCSAVSLDFGVPVDQLVERYWRQEDGGTAASAAAWHLPASPSSSLKKLSLIGNAQVCDSTLATLFHPIRGTGQAAGATFFSNLSTLDLSLCRRVASISPLIPLAGSLRTLRLRSTTISTGGIDQIHALPLLESLDLQDTTRIGHLAAVLTHPHLRTLDLRGFAFHCDEVDVPAGVGDNSDNAPLRLDLLDSTAPPQDASGEDETKALLLPGLATDKVAAESSYLLSTATSARYTPLPQELTGSPLETLLFSFGTDVFDKAIAPLLLYGSEFCPTHSSQHRLRGNGRALPALQRLLFCGSPKAMFDGSRSGILDRDRAVQLELESVTLTRPLLTVKRV